MGLIRLIKRKRICGFLKESEMVSLIGKKNQGNCMLKSSAWRDS